MENKMELRGYQEELVSDIIRLYNEGKPAVLLPAPPRCGKTAMAASAMARIASKDSGHRVLYLAHTNLLLKQTLAEISKWFPDVGIIGLVQADNSDCGKFFTCASMQTLVKEERLHELLQYGAITHLIVDEVHRRLAESYVTIVERLRANGLKFELGLTATPIRTDGRDVSQAVYQGNIARLANGNTPTIAEMVGRGWMVNPMGISVKVASERKLDEPKNGDDYTDKQIAAVMDTKTTILDAYRVWSGEAPEVQGFSSKDRLTLGFTPTVEMARNCAELFTQKGVKSDYVAAERKDYENDEVIKRFEKGDIRVVFNAMMLVEGITLPYVSCILWMRPTKSSLLYIQGVARGLGLFDGKSNCVIYDLKPNGAHNLVQAEDIVTTIRAPKEQKKIEKAIDDVLVSSWYLNNKGESVSAIPNELVVRVMELVLASKHAWYLHKDIGVISLGGTQPTQLTGKPEYKNRYVVFMPPMACLPEKVQAMLGQHSLFDPYTTSKKCSVFQVFQYPENSKTLKLFGVYDTMLDAQNGAEQAVKAIENRYLAGKEGTWRSNKASEEQVKILAKFHVPNANMMTRGQASQCLGWIFCMKLFGIKYN